METLLRGITIPPLIRQPIWSYTEDSRRSAVWPIPIRPMPRHGRKQKKTIDCFGTTHCDYFYHEIPCTPELTPEEINGDYELNTGKAIIRTMRDKDYTSMPGILVANHGPFTWGKDAKGAVYNSVVLEELARMAQLTLSINKDITEIQAALMDKHYLRKHGKNAYYGQKAGRELKG